MRISFFFSFSFFLWLTCKLAGAFPQILLVISAGRIETIAKCKNPIDIVLYCIVLYCIETPGGGGGYSPKFWIGVCRERSQTLTLSKDKENEN